VAGTRGYKYFGAAKDLPGVRELFEAIPADVGRKTRAEYMKQIDADYYGFVCYISLLLNCVSSFCSYMDDDDGLLVPLEAEAEREGLFNCDYFFGNCLIDFSCFNFVVQLLIRDLFFSHRTRHCRISC
jgi:hypothetical protein